MRTEEPQKMLRPQSRLSLFPEHNTVHQTLRGTEQQSSPPETMSHDGSQRYAFWRLQLLPFIPLTARDWAHQLMKDEVWWGRKVLLGRFKSRVVHIEFDSHQIFISITFKEGSKHTWKTSVLWVTGDDSRSKLVSHSAENWKKYRLIVFVPNRIFQLLTAEQKTSNSPRSYFCN